MGEIKSTLDLVMEKTKNLSLSSEEKQAQKNQEIKKRIRGLLQKFKDQALNVDNLKAEYQQMQKDYDLSGNAPLIREICGQIEFGADNQAWLELLAQSEAGDIERVASVLREFDKAIAAAAQEQSEILRDKLAKVHSISGSAVVPNLETDKAWQEKAGQIRARFETLLNQAKTELLDAHAS